MRFRGVLKEYAPLWDFLLRGMDSLMILGTAWLASLLYIGELPRTPQYAYGLLLAVLVSQLVFPGLGVYRAWRGLSPGRELRALSIAWLTTVGALSFLAFLTKTGPEFSRGWFLIWLMSGWSVLLSSRLMLRFILKLMREKGYNSRRILLLGRPRQLDDLLQRVQQNPWMGFRVAASFALPEEGPATDDTPVLSRFEHHVATSPVDQVWVALPLKDEAVIHRVQEILRYTTADLRYFPDMSGLQLLNHSISDVAGLPVINLSTSGMSTSDRFLKVLEDKALAALFLLLLAPLMLLIALAIRLDSPGPVLFRQRRSGMGGEPITILKFRSMFAHDEAPGHVTQARPGDPRITRVGAWLRRTSLDELPQLFNVLAGEMSLVGPRPHAVEHNEHYKKLIDSYVARHKVKPGITGWAQVHGYRGETDTLDKMQKRVEYDLYYLEHWSLWLDLHIIILTILRLPFMRNAH